MRPHRHQFASHNQADVLYSIKFGEGGQHLIAQQSWLCNTGSVYRRLNYWYGCAVIRMKVPLVRQVEDLRVFPLEDGFEGVRSINGILLKILVRPPQELYRGNSQYLSGPLRFTLSDAPSGFL